MALKLSIFDDTVALGSDQATGARGTLTRIINGCGHTSVLGECVSNSPSSDNQFVCSPSGFDCIGVVAEAGVAQGAPCWVWKNGSRCQVLFADGQSATRGQIALGSDTDGRAYNIAVPDSNPVQAEHFREIGHVCESKIAGTNVLVLCDIHFN